jgi:hypothetical protein
MRARRRDARLYSCKHHRFAAAPFTGDKEFVTVLRSLTNIQASRQIDYIDWGVFLWKCTRFAIKEWFVLRKRISVNILVNNAGWDVFRLFLPKTSSGNHSVLYPVQAPGVLGFKPALRQWGGQDGQHEAQQRDHGR